MSLAFTLLDLDGLDEFFEGGMSALRLVIFVLAVLVAVAVVQVCVDRVRRRVRVQR